MNVNYFWLGGKRVRSIKEELLSGRDVFYASIGYVRQDYVLAAQEGGYAFLYEPHPKQHVISMCEIIKGKKLSAGKSGIWLQQDLLLKIPVKRSTLLKIPCLEYFNQGRLGNFFKLNEEQSRALVLEVKSSKEFEGLSLGENNTALRQFDSLKRIEVEKIAINEVTKFYENEGYNVSSVAKDNRGWDLDARIGNRTFKLEVKGLSGKEVIVELTPNEYQKMKSFKKDYRICIVNECLYHPVLRIFSFVDEEWRDKQGNVLEIQERVAARLKLA